MQSGSMEFVSMCMWNVRPTQEDRQTDKHEGGVFRQCTTRNTKHIWRQRSPVLWAWRWKTKKSDFSHFLLRHRKLPESCQEQEGLISSGSDSPEHVTLSFTHNSQRKVHKWHYILSLCIYRSATRFINAPRYVCREAALLIRLNHSTVDRNNVGGGLSPCSLCTDIFYRCCVNSCGHAAEDVAPANSFSAG